MLAYRQKYIKKYSDTIKCLSENYKEKENSNNKKKRNGKKGIDYESENVRWDGTIPAFSLSSVADLSILDFGEHLLSLEPPLSENDYSFALGTEEGLSDLFDFKF